MAGHGIPWYQVVMRDYCQIVVLVDARDQIVHLSLEYLKGLTIHYLFDTYYNRNV